MGRIGTGAGHWETTHWHPSRPSWCVRMLVRVLVRVRVRVRVWVLVSTRLWWTAKWKLMLSLSLSLACVSRRCRPAPAVLLSRLVLLRTHTVLEPRLERHPTNTDADAWLHVLSRSRGARRPVCMLPNPYPRSRTRSVRVRMRMRVRPAHRRRRPLQVLLLVHPRHPHPSHSSRPHPTNTRLLLWGPTRAPRAPRKRHRRPDVHDARSAHDPDGWPAA